MLERGIKVAIEQVAILGADYLLPLMVFVFLFGMSFRALLYLTLKFEFVFTREFEKRVHKYMAEPRENRIRSFHQLVRLLLEKTYYEVFDLKRKYRRRRFDHITTTTERLFLVQDGAARIIRDTLKQTKYLRKEGAPPKFVDTAKFVFDTNPVFTRVLGVIPAGISNDLLNILPGLFVIGGIFGTFLGIIKALPELSMMDLSNPQATKEVMDLFLTRVAFSMSASAIGIMLCVMMTIANTILSPETLFMESVNRYTASLEFLWNETDNNESSPDGDKFAEPKDSVDGKGPPERRKAA